MSIDSQVARVRYPQLPQSMLGLTLDSCLPELDPLSWIVRSQTKAPYLTYAYLTA